MNSIQQQVKTLRRFQFLREYFQATRINHKHTSRKLRPTSIDQCSTNWKTWYWERSHRSVTIRSIAKGISDLSVETFSYYGNIFEMSCFFSRNILWNNDVFSRLTKFYFKVSSILFDLHIIAIYIEIYKRKLILN